MVSIEQKYPKLIESIVSTLSGYENNFRNDEEYAMVIVDNFMTRREQVIQHANWLIKKENSDGDVELRDVNQYRTFTLIPTEEPEDTSVTVGNNNNASIVVDEEPEIIELPRPPIISITPPTPPTIINFGNGGGSYRGGDLRVFDYEFRNPSFVNEEVFNTRLL